MTKATPPTEPASSRMRKAAQQPPVAPPAGFVEPPNPPGVVDLPPRPGDGPAPTYAASRAVASEPQSAPRAPAKRPSGEAPVAPPVSDASETPPVAATPPAPVATPPQKREVTPERLGKMREVLRDIVFKDMPKGGKANLTADVTKKLSELRQSGEHEQADQLLLSETAKAIEAGQSMTQEERDRRTKFFEGRAAAHDEVFKKHPEVLERHEAELSGKKGDQLPAKTDFEKELDGVYDEFPELERSPDGPRKAMLLAEKEIHRKTLQATVDADAVKAAAEPARRAASAAAAALSRGGSPPPPTSAPPALGAFEQTVAQRLSINPEKWVERMAGPRGKGGGIQLMPESFYTNSHKPPQRPNR